MRLGVFGGTFDPVHNGHLALAEAALDAFALDRVLLVPGHVTPFKLGRSTAPDADRLVMLRLAVADRPRLEVSSIELDRGGVSYTVDTLEALRAAHPSDELWLLLGLDSLLTLGLWRRAHDILRLATVGTLLRPGSTLPSGDLPGFTSEESAALRAHVADGACPDISSTGIRQSLRERGTAEGLPPAVLDHIRSRRLYGISCSDFR